MSNIVLIGFMGSGKSSVASKISSISDYEFIDTDFLIEKKSKLTISEIFKIFGEKYFRELEREVINELLSNKKKLVIATGGGLPCYFENINKLKTLGKIFFLNVSKKILLKRILNDNKRPLRFTQNLFEKRQHYYTSLADYVISCDTKSIGDIAEEILLIKKFKELL